jgi:hypothetical protein
MTAEPIDLNNRGIKLRVITEITKDNISYCKELMKLSIELRHLDDVKGNFSVSDGGSSICLLHVHRSNRYHLCRKEH